MLREFFSWWLAQLAALLPDILRRSARVVENALVITPTEMAQGANVTVLLRHKGQETPLGRFPLASVELGRLRQHAGRLAVIRLAPAEVLAKTVTLPLAAQTDLAQVLAFEMDRETPFTVDELYWTYRVVAIDRAAGQLSVRLLLVRKAVLAPLVDAFGAVGITPRRVEIAEGPDAGSYLPIDETGGRLDRAPRLLLRPAMALCAALAVAIVATPFIQQSRALASLDRQITAGRAAAAEADRLHKEIGRLSRNAKLITGERAKEARPLEVLAATTRILPDSTYLSEFRLHRRKVTLSGRSPAAARLIGALAGSGEFHAPTFAAPVTRIEALKTEVFTIVAEFGP